MKLYNILINGTVERSLLRSSQILKAFPRPGLKAWLTAAQIGEWRGMPFDATTVITIKRIQ